VIAGVSQRVDRSCWLFGDFKECERKFLRFLWLFLHAIHENSILSIGMGETCPILSVKKPVLSSTLTFKGRKNFISLRSLCSQVMTIDSDRFCRFVEEKLVLRIQIGCREKIACKCAPIPLFPRPEMSVVSSHLSRHANF
jgi:hypothetical protein